MQRRTRPTFKPEFRLEAAQLVVDQSHSEGLGILGDCFS